MDLRPNLVSKERKTVKAKKGRRKKKRKKKEKPRRNVWNYDYEYGPLDFCMEIMNFV